MKGAIHLCGRVIPKLLIGDGEYEELRIDSSIALESLRLVGITGERRLLNIKRISAPNLRFQAGGVLELTNLTIEKLDFEALSQNGGTIRVQNVLFKDIFRIINTDLGRVVFNEVDFSTAKLCLDNTYIGDCVFTNVKWRPKKLLFTSNQLTGSDYSNSLKEALILKEVYRQLKNVMKAHSNNIDALGFYRNEMDQYWIEINRDNAVSFGDKFIVFVNKYSSDFGLSLGRPLILLLAIHLILFLLMILNGFDDLVMFRNVNLESTWKGFVDFWVLLSPVRRSLDNGSSCTVFLDFLMRISSSFFIYHIIRATRKFGKL